MRKSFLSAALILATTLTAHAAQADSQSQSDSMNCTEFDKPIITHDYTSAPSDILHPHHLELTRPFAPNAKLKLHICRSDLRINIRPDAKEIKLTVDLDTQSGSYTVADSIQTIRVQPDKGVINLNFPKAAHATVTVTLPMGLNSENEINLGYGDLDFNAIGSAGNREVNVGMGHMQLIVDNDKNYSKMEVNVGMGTLHDHRPGGHDGHIVVSKNYSGTGAGSLQINVGMGSLDIRND
ncbi:hypothetical protein [Tunturibacter empetritectus]|uniref:Adhesin domain-containing protein n=1 Tax=Tunturiibacter lichenicola TaxID=2051959 RepID=A0A7W8N2Z7_9BACT|nr:hypothetical protein [Edaphobacter lichenicola]MBB5342933.1 hypothetical protein [Edaphobacter lichenicola]